MDAHLLHVDGGILQTQTVKLLVLSSRIRVPACIILGLHNHSSNCLAKMVNHVFFSKRARAGSFISLMNNSNKCRVHQYLSCANSSKRVAVQG
jgi:hypothetical protein